MTTIVVNVKTDPFDVYIGRPSKWSNPFHIGKDGNRATVIAKYIGWFAMHQGLLNELWQLKDKRIGCYCAPKPCHGDWLAQLCNAKPGIAYGLQGIWDPFSFQPDSLDRRDTGYLFVNGERIVGAPLRVRSRGNVSDLFTKYEEPPQTIMSIWHERPVAWRALRPQQIESSAHHV